MNSPLPESGSEKLHRGGQQRMIKVLGFALYGPLAASTRYRLGQYVPGLVRHGIDLQIQYLLGDEYLRRRFSGGAMPVGEMLRSGFDRLRVLRGDYDAFMLYCELFPLLPGWLERLLLRRPYIYDMDDAFYLKYRTGRLRHLSPLLGRKADKAMIGASSVSAGSGVLAEYARDYNKAACVLPTVVDTDRYLPAPRAFDKTFTVGWIGSPTTSVYLSQLVAPLAEIGKEGPVHFVVVGGKAPAIPNVKVSEVAWQEAHEIALINSFDVGVMPLSDDPWARGKCAFKLIQYMACGVPVIASPVGANLEVVTDDCGMLAASDEEWRAALRTMRDSQDLRIEMGKAGRQRVEGHYSLRRNLPILAGIIRNIVNGDP